MHPTPPASARPPRWIFGAAAIAIAIVLALALWRPWAPGATRTSAASEDLAVIEPAALSLPDAPKVLIFGDSWTYGSAASLPTLGYAYIVGEQLGWETTVNGVRGSGYLKPGIDGGSFGERIAALDPSLDPDLIIVQGSINDRRLPAAGYKDAVTSAWDALAALYPDASIVVLGPAPQVLPVRTATARIDRDLSALAATRGWWYISPIREAWITDSNYGDVIDTGIGRNHPSTAGHAYLAERLAGALDAISDTATVAAEAPLESVNSGE